MTKIKKTTLHIRGMHCPSCDILITDKIKELAQVTEVKANHRTQKAEVCYVGSFGEREILEVNRRIGQFGYQVQEGFRDQGFGVSQEDPLTKRVFDAGAIAVIFFIVFFFAQELNLIPSFSSGSSLTFTTVFILGLVASTSTCMATSGALFLATVGKLDVGSSRPDAKTSNFKVPTSNIIPALSFNLGRIISYGFFGFLAGLLGKTIAYNFQLSSILTLVVSFFMVIIGLDMAKIISLQSLFTQSITKGIFERVEHRLIKNPRKTAFFLGAITYLLPCGFTQTVQLYALGLADPVKSSLIMMVFAIGTMPALIAIGFATSFTKSRHFAFAQKIMGTLVFLIGVYYFSNFLGLYGVNIDLIPSLTAKNTGSIVNVLEKDGFQIASMNVNFSGYSPNVFTVKKDVPVKWEINGENVFGCQGFLVVPKLGISRTLALGQNVIEFTPRDEGQIGFSCGMGMYRGVFNVVRG